MKSQLRKHIAGHAPSGKVEKLRICQLCPATFPLSRGSRQVFNDHMRVVHNECISYRKRAPAFHLCTCHLCGKIFRHKRLLTNHMKVHNTDKSFECDNCDAKFTQKRYLTRHKKYTHEKNPYPSRQTEEREHHFCTNCGKTFSSIKSMFAHFAHCGAYVEPLSEAIAVQGGTPRLRTSTKPAVSCDICNKGFRTMESLLKHMYYHSREYKDKMNAYMRNKTPVMCPTCGVFTKTLSQHLLLHTARYTCNICNKEVNRKDSLEIHMRVHTGERPFVCFLCGNSYKQRPDMDRHQRKVHNFEPVASKRVDDIIRVPP